MNYTKTNWQDLPNTTTPINATRLNNMENGIADANGSIDVDAYSDSSTYVVGDYCIYNNKLYICNTAIETAESFNSSHWTETNIIDEINNINNNTKTNMQTDTAKELEITDSANALASFNKVEGDTYQATRDGKNLINEFSNQTLIIDNDGWITYSNTNSGSSTAYANLIFSPNLNLQLNKLYYFVLEVKSISSTVASNTAITIASNNTGSNKGQFITNRAYSFSQLQADDIQITNSTTRDSFDGCETFSRSYITIPAGATISITFRLSVVAQQPTAETFVYEPYGVSPSPDYPSDIRNVGDNINLLNLTDRTETTSHDLTFSAENGILNINGTCSSGFGFTLGTIPKIKKGTYTLGTNSKGSSSVGAFGLYLYDSSNNQLFDSGNIANNFNTTKQITLSQDYENVSFTCYIGGTTKFENITFKLKIEEGTQQTGFSPYNCGSIDFNVETKNKFVGWTRNIQTNSNNGQRVTMTNSLSSDFCKIEPSTAYRLSGLAIGNYGKNKFIVYYDINKNYISRTGSTNVSSITQTTPANAYYCTVAIAQGFDSATTMENFISDCSQIQLEKGTSITSYQEYGKQEITFPLSSGQLLHKGDYLADDGIHQVRGTLIFDGTESWIYNTANACVSLNTTSMNIKLNNDNNILCNRLKAAAKKNEEGFNTVSSNSLYFKVNGCTTLQEYRDKLAEWASAGVPLTFEDDYIEPIVTPYTTEQAEAYYKLKHFLTYEGYTLIECIDNMKPDIQVNYLYNNKVNNYYGNIIYELQNRLHQLENS